MARDRLFKGGLAQTLGSNLTCCFSLCISASLFISKLQKNTPIDPDKICEESLVQSCEQASRKFALNFMLT
jgi:hypothetical protein